MRQPAMKPCPSCGGKAATVKPVDGFGWSVQCRTPGCWKATKFCYRGPNGKIRAIKAWNKGEVR